MAVLDLASLLEPVDDGSPCGVDLELAEDDDFLNFISASEMTLPDRYFVEDHEGNRKPFYADDRFQDLNLGAHVASAAKLLRRTHDLRLLSLAAKLSIFDRKLDDFTTAIEAVAGLLERFWQPLHPGPDSGLRVGEIERLNEPFTVVTALNNAPLFRSRRFGTLSRQTYLAAVRETGGDGESNTAAVDRILTEECKNDLGPITAVQARLSELSVALQRIHAIFLENSPSNSPDLGRLNAALTSIRAMLDRINPPPVTADPEAAEAPADGAVATVDLTGTFPSTRLAARALAQAASYLHATEPSSPALLLLRQAQALVGKSFLEALESLLPDHVRRATLSVSTLPVFELPLVQIAEKGVSADDGELVDESVEADGTEDAAALSMISSRAEALALLDRVASHYRVVEPSSPIPILIDRARNLAGKDFVTLITSMLPDHVLRGE